MAEFDEYDNYDKKLELSEGTVHVRESNQKEKKKLEGYEPNPQDEKYYEVMGIKNSFDNLSVGTDRYGQMLVSVNSMKEPGAPTLTSDRKIMKSARRKKKIEAFGDFYTNLSSDRNGAFAFRADRNISEIRMVREFERIAKKRVSREQREALPFLQLDEDSAELSELRGKSGSLNENVGERRRLEKRVQKETEYRNRFMAKLRMARRRTYDKHEDLDEQNAFLKALSLSDDTGDEDETDDTGIGDEIIDEIIDEDDDKL